MSGSLQATFVEDANALELLVNDWWELWREAGASPFQSPAWLLPWWRNFHPGRLETIAVHHGKRLVGLAPFYLEERKEMRRLLPLGISVSDYFDVLVAPGFEELASASITTALLRAPLPWDRWELEELPPHVWARRLPCPMHCREEAMNQSVCPVLVLPSSRDALPSRSDRRKRQHLNLARNRASRRGGIEFRIVDGAGAEEFLADLLRLHTARWEARGEDGLFGDGRVRRFHRDSAKLLCRANLAHFYVATIGGNVIAAVYALVWGNRLLYYLSGFDPNYSFESPGELLLAYIIEAAQQQGMREFHFLRGREPYKYAWNPVERINVKRSFVRASDRSVEHHERQTARDH
jgi:CelD/BcsL family acetyltransferase involved in cellulose biosynthesis